MSITIRFEDVPTGLLTGYANQGFGFTSQFAATTPTGEAFWNRAYISNLGTGGYLINQLSSDTITVKPAGGQAFGASSIDVNGFSFKGFNGDQPLTGTQVVTFNFTALKAGSYDTVEYSFTTDNVDAFQTVILPAAFKSGLLWLSWNVSGATENWGAFDNLVLEPNRAPVAQAFTGQITGGQTFTGRLSATDPDGQAVTFKAVGALPPGVVLDANGTFYVQPQAGDADLAGAESRTVSFQYLATDGALQSSVATASVKITGVPNGPDICGTIWADRLTGTNGGEKIFGFFGNDRVDARGGADKIWGGDGCDQILGGAGADVIFGDDDCDTLEGGAGNDTLTGGWDNDAFVFGRDFGHDVITDFQSGHYDPGFLWLKPQWDPGDVIQISPAVFSNFNDLMAHARQTWTGVVITTDDGQNSLTLVGQSLWGLNARDFVFA
ncbi:calcium-binding protein [Phenylobacterium deserti]|uniref:Calcium-binding protein n=1 Tax=Phenylobacterium deserti TaxID=1914756 RepID=A0A328AD40_9CAUL|nr:calcium-binding protein [Phenylobacterium deserti]RAK52589.1 hypothetical protein DJ018_10285 [Phenylobacterium deserti]